MSLLSCLPPPPTIETTARLKITQCPGTQKPSYLGEDPPQWICDKLYDGVLNDQRPRWRPFWREMKTEEMKDLPGPILVPHCTPEPHIIIGHWQKQWQSCWYFTYSGPLPRKQPSFHHNETPWRDTIGIPYPLMRMRNKPSVAL